MEAPPEPEVRREGWHLTGDAREAYVRGLFDGIAEPYDRLNRVISLGRDPTWRRVAVAMSKVRPGERVLDLGTGTGDLAFAFAEAVVMLLLPLIAPGVEGLAESVLDAVLLSLLVGPVILWRVRAAARSAASAEGGPSRS